MAAFLQSLRARWQRLLFLEHLPEAGIVTLHQRRVFTLPAKPGWAMLGLLVVMFIAATNYSLSLGFALTFLLAGIAAINIFLTFRNLAYLQLEAFAGAPVFVGDSAGFTLRIRNNKPFARYAIWLSDHASPNLAQAVDIQASSEAVLTLHRATAQRGWQQAPRIRLQTWFPLGLLRAWSTWYPAVQVLVYPEPEPAAPPLPGASGDRHGHQEVSGNEEFAGIRNYQPGDPLKHLAWKQIARSHASGSELLYSKQFARQVSGELLLDFASLPARMALELRISRMTAWVLEAERQGRPYAFRLASQHFPAALGATHQHACLSALALFGAE